MSNNIESSLVNINYNSGLGLLSELRNLYGNLSLKLNKRQLLSLRVYTEQETKFFTKAKLSGAYSTGIELNKSGVLSFSTQLNLAYIGFSSNFIRGNDWGLDFSLSSAYETSKSLTGFGFLQVPGTEITPINSGIILERYFEFFSKYNFNLNSNLTWQTGILSRFREGFFTIENDNQLSFQEKHGILASVGLTNQKKIGFSLGGKLNLNSYIPFVDLYFSYSNITNQESINSNSYSISIIRKH